MKKLIDMWQSYLNNSEFLSKNTIISYMLDFESFMKFLLEFKSENITKKDLISLTKQDLRAWALYRKNKAVSDRSISRGISAIKNFLRFCIKTNIIEECNIIAMKSPKIKKGLPRPISIEKINDILSSIHSLKQTNWIIKRDKALLVLIYSVGLRINEALQLNRQDIENNADFLNILGKGDKVRAVPLVKKVREIIFDYIKSLDLINLSDISDALFVNRFGLRLTASAVQKLIQASRKMLNLPDAVTPHALRHSCATHIIENGGDLRSVQELLGHSSISSTQVYTDIAKTHLSNIYDQCHPMSKKNQK
ncbi:MAG: tyrosine recombinase XerC [Holosporales bacterium]|nr:tyrosine recombinase XerC [Holosporales bacterium]